MRKIVSPPTIHQRPILLLFLMTLAISGCALFDRGPDEPRVIPRQPSPEAFAAHTKAPEHPDQLALARQLTDQGHYAVALGRLKACGQEDDPAELHYLKGICLREQGRLNDSIRHFKACLDISPNHALARNGLGLALEKRGDPASAQAAFREAIRLNPARDDFYNNLGYSLMQTGNLTPAEDCLRQGLKLDADNRQLANNLALCLGRMGRDQEALAVLKQHHAPAAACNNMGAIYVLINQPDKAAAMYRQALSLAPALSETNRNYHTDPGQQP